MSDDTLPDELPGEKPAKKAAGGIKGALSKKIGPLPAYAWALGIGGGLILAAWVRRAYGGSSNAGDAIDGDYAVPAGTGGAAVSEPGYTGTGGYDSGYDDDGAGTVDNTPTNNNEWRKAAILAAIGFGSGALAAQRMVDRYLTGKRLNKAQESRMNQVVAQIGPPPTPTPIPPPPKNQGSHGNNTGGNGQGGNAGGGSGGGSQSHAPKNNAEWAAKGLRKLVENGWTKSVVDEALDRFLAGKRLTQKQRHIVDTVISKIGAPPKTPPKAGGKPEGTAWAPDTRRDQGAGITPSHNPR